jgi:hypothetical protein
MNGEAAVAPRVMRNATQQTSPCRAGRAGVASRKWSGSLLKQIVLAKRPELRPLNETPIARLSKQQIGDEAAAVEPYCDVLTSLRALIAHRSYSLILSRSMATPRAGID